MSLNENQQRAVTVTLRLLEEQLAEAERKMQADERGILYHRTADLSARKREEMRLLIAKMRIEIRTAAEQFDLMPDERDAAQEIVASLGLRWESLEEIRSRKLRGYGPVDVSLRKTLDPIVDRLIRLTLELEHVAGGKRRG